MKTKGFFRHTYFNTYYYANIVNNVLSGDAELMGFISNFFAHEGILYSLAEPFQKRSAFHVFIEHIVGEFFDHDMHEHDERDFEYCQLNAHATFTPYAANVLGHYGMDNCLDGEEFKSYEDVEKYHNELYLTGILLDLYEVIADEIFYLMFNNRKVLLLFNDMIAQHMKDIDLVDFDEKEYEQAIKLFTKAGILKRVKIPEWCKKAVYFRDRGRCCLCHKDLSGTLSLNNKNHYDHIIPLAQGGLNDVANIQLLCDGCNTSKGAKSIVTSEFYERWF